MKPILESWRRYLKEEFAEEEKQYFGKPLELGDQIVQMFQEYLKNTVIPAVNKAKPDADSITIDDVQRYLQFFTDDVEMNLDVTKVGCGKFRCVFRYKEAKEIIKVDITPYGIGKEHNKDDHTLGTISLPYEIFPKSYAHAPDFSWILLERVTPFDKNLSAYVSFFPNSILTQKRATDQTKYYCILAAFMYGSGKYDNANRFLLRYVPSSIVDTNIPEEVEKMVAAFRGKGGKTFDDVLKVINQFGMRPEEVALRNTGLGSGNRFVILDSSVDSAIIRGFEQKAPPSPAAGAETVKV